MSSQTRTQAGRDDLVFILGLHRSGTTILYNLLAKFGRYACPSPFHIVTYDTFRRDGLDAAAALRPRLEQRFADDGITDRFIDDIHAGVDTPEEYGFVLPGGSTRPATLSHLDALCDFLTQTAAADAPGVLLKNPRDALHIDFLMRSYPKAKFIYIHRRPESVLHSRSRELRDLFHSRSAYQAIIEPLYDRLSSSPIKFRTIGLCTRLQPLFGLYLAQLQARELRAYLAAAHRGWPVSIIELRYEDLLEQPGEQFNRVLGVLGRPTVDEAQVAAQLRPPRTQSNTTPPGAWLLRRMARAYYKRWDYAPVSATG